MIKINCVSYQGNNISINNGVVIINGKEIKSDEKIVNIKIEGNIENLTVNACDKLNVSGNVYTLESISGDVNCGDVTGNVRTVSGDVCCKQVNGNVNTISGDINKY